MNTAELVRIFEPSPDDDYVAKLFAFAESMVAGVANTKLAGDLRAETIAALSAASPSFVEDGQDLQIFICALGGGMKLLAEVKHSENGRGVTEVFSAALHTGLSALRSNGNAKIDQAVKEMVTASARAFQATAEIGRNRQDVPELKAVVDAADTPITAADKVTASANLSIMALRNNAALDREELDLLWFCLSDHSLALNEKMSKLKASVGVVASAL